MIWHQLTKNIQYIYNMINRESEISQGNKQSNLSLLIPKSEQEENTPPKKERLQSLDAYRGFTIIGMAFADHLQVLDGSFWWLVHPDWNGLSLADLVFPAFLFIMGISIPLATNKNRPIRPKNIIRVFLLFAIGLFLNIIEQQFDFANLRILGILQRLSICYGIVLFIHWVTDYGTHVLKRTFAGLVMVAMVILYVALMISWQKPEIGCFRSNNLDPYCNFAGYVDRAVFTQSHIMQKTDPEGIISNMTASFTTFTGYCFGLMLISLRGKQEKLIKYWLIIALLCAVPIYPCSLLMPLNKRLYTITFLLTVLSTSITILTLFLLVIDYLPKVGGKGPKIINVIIQPLTWLGMNPLAIFIVLQLLADIMLNWIEVDGKSPYQIAYEALFSWASPGIGTLLYSCIYVIFYIVVAGVLFKFKLFLRL